MLHHYYIHHAILEHASEYPDELVYPYRDIVCKNPRLNFKPTQLISVIDELASLGVINTITGVDSEYKRVLANENTSEFLSKGGFINTDDLKIHEILRFIKEQRDLNPDKQTFGVEELRTELFFDELKLRVDSSEIDYLIRILVKDGISLSQPSELVQGSIDLSITQATIDAYHTKSYLKKYSPIKTENDSENLPRNWLKKNTVKVITWLLGLIASLITIITFIQVEKPSSLQLIVYVHGPKGELDILDEIDGKILVAFGNDLRSPSIGENGRTSLGEIPMSFLNEEVKVNIQASGYELINPDQKFIMDGEPIYLGVMRLDRLRTIKGVVKDIGGDRLIEKALVLIGVDTAIYTDKYGRFNIDLPKKWKRESYLLDVSKKGFLSKSYEYYPESGDAEIRLRQEK